MKRYTTILTFLICSQLLKGQNDLILKLNYVRTADNTVWTHGFDKLTLKENNKVVGEYLTDSLGIATIPSKILAKKRSVDLYLTSIGVDANYLITLNKDFKDTIIIKLPKEYKGNYAKCPKCNKSDKVLKTVYGLEQIVSFRIEKGDTIYSPKVGKKYYLGSCIDNEFNPRYYCDRDSIFY